MKLLLDTNTLLWFISNDPQLSAAARENIENQAHEKFVSSAGLWEIALKLSLGKMKLPRRVGEVFHRNVKSTVLKCSRFPVGN
jgi:PIN domain nuclease of toxin-antitoxin system